MDCQIKPLFIQYEEICIVFLIFRSILADEMNHVVHGAGQLLDFVGPEVSDWTIRILIFAEISSLIKLNGVQYNRNFVVIKNTLVEYPFLDLLSNLLSQLMSQEVGDCMNPLWR